MVERRGATFPEISGHFGSEGEFWQQTKGNWSGGTNSFSETLETADKNPLTKRAINYLIALPHFNRET
jgi:hypothetical protein